MLVNATLENIVASIVGALAHWLMQGIAGYVREGRGGLTGQWDELIGKQRGQPKKHDVVQCFDRGSRLHGSIRRKAPRDQDHKRWEFAGRRQDNLIFLTFWSTNRDPIDNDSYGTIQLHPAGGAGHWEGFYVKLETKKAGSRQRAFTGALNEYELKWELRSRLSLSQRWRIMISSVFSFANARPSWRRAAVSDEHDLQRQR